MCLGVTIYFTFFVKILVRYAVRVFMIVHIVGLVSGFFSIPRDQVCHLSSVVLHLCSHC